MVFPEQNSQEMSVAIHHQFSIQWKQDYLKTLQRRYKWKFSVPNVHVGNLVIVMNDLQPPYEWRLGRIEIIHPGRTGICALQNHH